LRAAGIEKLLWAVDLRLIYQLGNRDEVGLPLSQPELLAREWSLHGSFGLGLSAPEIPTQKAYVPTFEVPNLWGSHAEYWVHSWDDDAS